MTVDIDKLKADLKAEIIAEITGKDYKSANSAKGPLGEVREKYKKPLLDTYGTYHFAQVWDHIRRLTCYMVGVRYVRELKPSLEERAAEIAETLCKMAIENGGKKL